MSVPARVRVGVTLVRVAAAAMMVIHGIARVRLGTVGGFGQFLESHGYPNGLVLAWILTIVEIAGGAILAAGYLVWPLALWFVSELATGIVLVHAKLGWFVVGAGQGGAEYSALLIAALLGAALADPVSNRLGRKLND
jgi:putative oxidoreductase